MGRYYISCDVRFKMTHTHESVVFRILTFTILLWNTVLKKKKQKQIKCVTVLTRYIIYLNLNTRNTINSYFFMKHVSIFKVGTCMHQSMCKFYVCQHAHQCVLTEKKHCCQPRSCINPENASQKDSSS